jgi:hypothetical protein
MAFTIRVTRSGVFRDWQEGKVMSGMEGPDPGIPPGRLRNLRRMLNEGDP